jgi:hypothetical protein
LLSPANAADALALAEVSSDRQMQPAPAALVTLDEHAPLRLASVLRHWRLSRGLAAGIDPQHLPKQRCRRLILALRALDGADRGVTYRLIAEHFYGPLGLSSHGEWRSHDTRDRAIRVVRLGRALRDGGYRTLLFYPYRKA